VRTTKLLLVPIVSFLLTAALLELSLPILHGRFAPYFRQRIIASKLNADDARRFFSYTPGKGSQYAFVFDPELGWDHDPITRDFVATKRYLAQSYGDSFVQGAEVGSEETWQAHFERLTGAAIVNLGVGGYGLDQSVLKFEKYARHYPTQLAILGLYSQTYRRSLSYHSFYYFTNNEAFTFVFKPIFVKKNERFELIHPPCTDAACIMEVLSSPDHDVWRLLTRYDYWYQVNQKKPVAGFPNTISYARALPEILRTRREGRGAENYFFVNPGALEVVEYLIERFVDDSRGMGMTPVCVILYAPPDLKLIKTGIRLDDQLLKFLAARNILHVDTAQYILDQYRYDDDFEGLRAPNGHLNSRGNLMVAEALSKGLSSMGILGH